MDDTNLKLSPERSPRWTWISLIAALIWIALVRVPLIVNAETHLDSDLAVDGLTLLDMTHGQWRWHFPGTPGMSSLPVILSLPGAVLFGVNAITLVAGGLIAYALFVVAMFFLVRRAFGPAAAAWSLVPLAFASVGTVWLSGRLSGGHLLTVTWHAAALAMLPTFLSSKRYLVALGYGIWCGMGFSLDGMFIMTLPFVALYSFKAILQVPGFFRGLAVFLLLIVGFAIGLVAKEVAVRTDAYDAYPDQFATIVERNQNGKLDFARMQVLFSEHARLLGLDCLPRLITGHLLSSADLPTEPKPGALAAPPARSAEASPVIAAATVGLGIAVFLASLCAIFRAAFAAKTPLAADLASIMAGSSVLVACFFLISKNIYNSDNYRYLIYFLVPFVAGYGSLMAGLWRKQAGGKVSAVLVSTLLAILFTCDTYAWYRSFGWVDSSGRPVRRRLDDQALDWLREHPEIDAVFGGYWDVYRYQFLLGGKPVGVPFPIYPDRFQTSENYPGRRPRTLVARNGEFNNFYRDAALRDRGRTLLKARDRQIIDWPPAK